MTPTIGQIVLYKLTADDANQINRRRTTGKSIAQRIASQLWPIGAQAHIGEEVVAGEEFPMVVVRVGHVHLPFEPTVNGQVLLDGNDVLWVKNKSEQVDWRWLERS